MITIFSMLGCWVSSDDKPTPQNELEQIIESVDVYSVLDEYANVDHSKYFSCADLESTVSVKEGYLPALAYEWIEVSSGEEEIISTETNLSAEEIHTTDQFYLRVIPTIDGVAYPTFTSDLIIFEEQGMVLMGATYNPVSANSVVDGIHAELKVSNFIEGDTSYEGGLIYNNCDDKMWEFQLQWYSVDNGDFYHETTNDMLQLYPCQDCEEDQIAQLSYGDEWQITVNGRREDWATFEYNNSISYFVQGPNHNEIPYTLNNSWVEVKNIEYLQDNDPVETAESTKNLKCKDETVDYDSDEIEPRNYKFEYIEAASDENQWTLIQSGESDTLETDTITGSWIPDNLPFEPVEAMIRCIVTTADSSGEYVFEGESIPIAGR